jgi:6-phosphogluconate dehydrogenase
LFARFTSALKTERVLAAQTLNGPFIDYLVDIDSTTVIEQVRQALYASKIISYAQGYMLLRAASVEYGWNLNYGGIALMWRGGCIIRSRFLGDIKAAFDKNPDLTSLMLDPFFTKAISDNQAAWRTVVSEAVLYGIPVPAMSSALAFYDSYRSETLPANLLQAQRDYFGAHTYERIENPGTFVHTNWTGQGGTTSSSTYNA